MALKAALLASLLLASPSRANPLPPDALFPADESLTYTLKFIDTTAGECMLETLAPTTWQGQPVRHFRASIKTVGLIALFYPYSETVDLYSERDHFRPVFVDVNIRDRGKKQHTQIRLDQTALHGEEIEDSTEPGEPPHHRVKGWTMTRDSQSLFSILYFLRTQNLAEGAKIRFPVSHDEKNAEFLGDVVRAEAVPTAHGERQGFLVSVSKAFANVFYGSIRDEPQLWFSADGRGIPLRFEFKHRMGRVFAILRNPPN